MSDKYYQKLNIQKKDFDEVNFFFLYIQKKLET